MIAVAFFYFKSEQRLMFDLTKSNMQNVAAKISSQIIFAHMTDTIFDTNELKNYPTFSVSLYDKHQKMVVGDIKERINFKEVLQEQETVFSNTIQKYNENYILLDTSTFGHLGVHFIAIKEHNYNEKINALLFNIALFFTVIYTIIALIGFFLAKLFIQPISKRRHTINNFIKDTTHELNTPITGLLMSTENEGVISQKSAERIRISARRISEIYNDLTYLFLQEKNSTAPVEDIALHTLLEEQIEYLKPFAQKKKIIFETSIEPLNYAIYKEDFIRLCNNLISNAIKYNKVAGTITIKLQNNQLIIQDSGIGIKAKQQKDIFKRYYRATSMHGGFGIGLNIVHHICTTYNIHIDVDSKENLGTTFKLTFPS